MLKYRASSAAAILAVAASCTNCAVAAPLSLEPRTMPAIASVGERYLSCNVAIAEVAGGKFGVALLLINTSQTRAPTIEVADDSSRNRERWRIRRAGAPRADGGGSASRVARPVACLRSKPRVGHPA